MDGREARDNPRFVITNLRQSPRWVYEQVHCGAARSRTGSRNCITASRLIAPAAVLRLNPEHRRVQEALKNVDTSG